MQYEFDYKNKILSFGICNALKELRFNPYSDVIVCIGTDGVIGDSLAPLCGSILRKKLPKLSVFGTLSSLITALNVESVYKILTKIFPNSKFLVIDAAIGEQESVGNVKIFDCGIRPGLGVSKNFDKVGDYSIIGVVAEKSSMAYSLLSTTRLSFVYAMAEAIAMGITDYCNRVFLSEKRECV